MHSNARPNSVGSRGKRLVFEVKGVFSLVDG